MEPEEKMHLIANALEELAKKVRATKDWNPQAGSSIIAEAIFYIDQENVAWIKMTEGLKNADDEDEIEIAVVKFPDPQREN